MNKKEKYHKKNLDNPNTPQILMKTLIVSTSNHLFLSLPSPNSKKPKDKLCFFIWKNKQMKLKETLCPNHIVQ